MPETGSSTLLDPRLALLLDNLRRRVRRYVVWDSVLAIAAVILAAFWIGLTLDYLPVWLGGTEMPRLARVILLLAVAVVVLGIVGWMLIGRLRRPLPDDSLALLVERHHPSLAGRLVTAVQLNRPGRSGDSHSPALLQHVHREAAASIDRVDPNRVFRWQPLMRKAMIAGLLLVAAIGLVIISPSAFGRAASRLTLLSDEPWPRRADLEMVGVELPVVSAQNIDAPPLLIPFDENGVVRLPRGSNPSLRIRAEAETAELPIVCTVYYRTDGSDDGQAGESIRGQSNMRRVGRVVDGYQSFVLDGPPLAGLSDSMTISVRGLDDRLDDFRIEAVTPPVLSSMNVAVRYPNYLRNPGSSDVDLETAYQSGLRIAEGSNVTMVATATRPLGDAEVVLDTVNDEPIDFDVTYSEDRRQMNVSIRDFRAATTVSIVPQDRDGISAQAPYRYFLGVVLDEPPELKMRLSGIGSAVTPIARIPIEATVEDDYGVEVLNVSVTPSVSPAAPISDAAPNSDADDPAQVVAPEKIAPEKTASRSPKLDRDGKASIELDLRDLIADGELAALVPGGAINVIGETSDRYDLTEPHLTRSEVFRLEIVTPEQLLSRLERSELALRARLEQTIDETRNLRGTLNLLRRGFGEDEPMADDEPATGEATTNEAATDAATTEQTRQVQIRRLRVQQSGLQAAKTAEELSGIAASLDDILREMMNNRVDSIDRQERIGAGVRDPLRQIVDEPLARLRDQIVDIERAVGDTDQAMQKTITSIETADEVLARLTEVLEKMLDLESYNEILDLFRELIEDQEKLLQDTKSERKKGVLDLFD